ncbi:uncharacterized protein LOC126886995 [Diabrotica virgifera virgifera]|uniref:Ig-like domain-containing protein n=1 Tax=Diabrotica virgifera virgifera TaxID=50390 RepID=A0ABM5KJ40_DIAVI|nr:uncharacterized protein LOC126886995 [Diabrotica virgifera virgifera]
MQTTIHHKMAKEIIKQYGTVFLAIVLFCVKGCWTLKEMRIGVPEAALSGDTVTLACEYNLEEVALYSIKWYWNDEEFYRYVPKESPPFRAFTVTFADFNVDIVRSGPTEVTLRNISREMTGDYKCEVSADAPLFHTDIQSAHMTVIDPPKSNPRLIIEEPPEPTIKIEIGKSVRAGCSAPWGPTSQLPPNITWFLNDEQIKPDHPTAQILPTKTEFNRTAQQKVSISKLEMTTTKSHFARGLLKIKCKVSFYSIWNKTMEMFFKEDSPQLASVLGSTSSQSHTDQVIEIITSSSCRSISVSKVLFLFIVTTIFIR